MGGAQMLGRERQPRTSKPTICPVKSIISSVASVIGFSAARRGARRFTASGTVDLDRVEAPDRVVLESMDAIKLDAVVYPSWNSLPH
jgi:hypothetical protein